MLQTLSFEHQQFGMYWMSPKDLFGQSEDFFEFLAFDEHLAHSQNAFDIRRSVGGSDIR